MKCKLPLLLLSSAPAVLLAEKKPNVMIIYIDDMGIGDLSCYGGALTRTPNIDRLAEEGIRFNQYYSAAPVSSPSRVSITTGQFPLNWAINTYLSDRKHNRNCEQKDFLDAGAPSMARAFRQAGYVTGHFGKWHMGGGRDVRNAPSIHAYGFDEYVSTWESPDPDPAITSGDWIWTSTDSIRRWDRTAYFVDKTVDFIRRNNDTPFFVNLWPDDVHTPWVPGEQYEEEKSSWDKDFTFVPVLRELDRQIGRLMQELAAMDKLDNTIIVFTSDNGPAPSFRQIRTNQLRGTKNSLYEGGIRMPMIVRWGDKIKKAKVDSASVICSVDFYPSLCRMAGIRPERNVTFDGTDMSKALTGKKVVKRKEPLFWDFGRNRFFNFPRGENRSPHLAVRKGAWKLMCNSDGTETELYDMVNDKAEKNNLSEMYPDVAGELKGELLKWYNSNLSCPE